MKIEDTYTEHTKWKHGVKQHVIVGDGETMQDAIRFMREHIRYFGYQDDLTFDEKEIEQAGDNEFIFKLRAKLNPNRQYELPSAPPLRMKMP